MLEIRVLFNNLFRADHQSKDDYLPGVYWLRSHYFQLANDELDLEVTFRCDLIEETFAAVCVYEQQALRIEGKAEELIKVLKDPASNRASKQIADFFLAALINHPVSEHATMPNQREHRFMHMKTVRKLADMELLEITDGENQIKMMVYANRADELVVGNYLAIDPQGDFQVLPASRVN